LNLGRWTSFIERFFSSPPSIRTTTHSHSSTGEREANAISKLTKFDILAFCATFIAPSSPTRTKLSILMRSQRLQPTALAPLITIFDDILPEPAKSDATKLLASKPTLAEVKAFVAKAFVDGSEIPEAVERELRALGKLPELKEGVREILEDEVEIFRRGLEKAGPVLAVDDYKSDLLAHL
jgi:insulysin